MYDNDIGFGYGAKAKFVDFLGKKESFDLILFNSSKGERWYVFTFSIPDIEIRQRKTYPLSFDFKAEYDKFLKYSYYGRGMDSREDDETILTHETKQPLPDLRPRLHSEAVGLGELCFPDDRLLRRPGRPFCRGIAPLEKKFAPYVSLIFSYDTSDSQIHPTRGFRLLLQDDLAADFVGSKDASFNRIMIDFRKYMLVFGRQGRVCFPDTRPIY